MASIDIRKDKNGNVVSYRIRVSRGRGLKPYIETVSLLDLPENFSHWSNKAKEKHLQALANNFERDCRNGLVATEKKKFSEYAVYVIDMKEKAGIIKHRTAVRYREILGRVCDENNKYAIGNILLEDLRAEHLNKFYNSLASEKQKKAGGKPLSAKTILEHHRLIGSILEQAFKENLVVQNVARKSMPPKVKKKEAEFYDIDLINRIIVALEDEEVKWQAFVHLLIGSGCRIGEIIGLRWKEVDFTNNTIHICNNVQYESDCGLFETTPKTESGIRTITLPQICMDKLKEWKAEQLKMNQVVFGNVAVINGFLFTSTKDFRKPMCRQAGQDFLDRFVQRHNLPHLHPHGFRHTQASMLLYNSTDFLTVSKRLGHSSTSITTDMYGHMLAKADKESAEKIENMLYAKRG